MNIFISGIYYALYLTSNQLISFTMETFENNDETNNARAAFTEILSDEFTSKTGVGVYAYLEPIEINQLFKQYLHQSKTIRVFAKVCVTNTLD